MADDKILKILRDAAEANGVDPNLAIAIAQTESNFNPNAVGVPVKGQRAQGLMQLMPDTAASLGVKNPLDPVQNAMGGTKYLKQLSDMFGGDPQLIAAGFNSGPGNVRKYGGIPPFAETQKYVPKVMGILQNLGNPVAPQDQNMTQGGSEYIPNGSVSNVNAPMSAPPNFNDTAMGGQSPINSQGNGVDLPSLIKMMQGGQQIQQPTIDPSAFVDNTPVSHTKGIFSKIMGGLSTALGTWLALNDSPAGPLLMNMGMGLFDKAGKANDKAEQQRKLNQFLTNPNVPANLRSIAGLSQYSPEAAKIYAETAKPQNPAQTLSGIKSALDIVNYETPAQKREAAQIDRQENQKALDTLITGRQKAIIAAQKANWSSNEAQDIGALEQVQGQFKSLPNELPANATLYKALSNVPVLGRAAASRQFPELAQFDKMVTDANAQLAFARGGKNLTGMEAKLTLGNLPDFLENPALYPIVKQSAESRLQLAKLARLTAMEKSGRDVGDYPLKEYKEWREALNSGIPIDQLQQSQAFQKATQDLGLQGLFVTLPGQK